MAAADRRRRSPAGRRLDALLWGTALGAASGAVLGDASDGIGAAAGAVIGVAVYAPAEVATTMSRAPGAVLPFPGHYLSSVDGGRDALTVLKLLSFHERILVFVTADGLRADHSFSLAGRRFLTLRYEIERLAPVA